MRITRRHRQDREERMGLRFLRRHPEALLAKLVYLVLQLDRGSLFYLSRLSFQDLLQILDGGIGKEQTQNRNRFSVLRILW